MTTLDENLPLASDAGYQRIALDNGRQASRYALRFDRDGRCVSPAHRADALREAALREVTDVFVYAHGWNNDWRAATERYDSFIAGFGTTWDAGHEVSLADDFQPLLIGIYWPSTILLLPGEDGPAIAGGEPGEPDRAELDELATAVEPRHRDELVGLLSGDTLDLAGALSLAAIVAPLVASDDDEAPEASEPPSPRELATLWKSLVGDEPARGSASGTVDERWGGEVQAAGFSLDPRKLIRLLTVRTMKDRAGVVGARGVAPLLSELLGSTAGNVHLVGHSFGCKVCLSAICVEPLPEGKQVDSLLLLQPAVNHRCFALDARDGKPGGYRSALDRVRKPILTTFSEHDAPLRTWFHRALTRRQDDGEAAIAALPAIPSPYAALGGYGPRGAPLQTEEVDLLDPGTRYKPARAGTRLLAIDGARGIPDHGGVSNAYTWWALYDQVAPR